MSQEQPLKPVLSVSVHDVRYFAALLRGVNFATRATVAAHKAGLVISVEEARTLLATAYVDADVFDEFTYTHPPAPARRQRLGSNSSQNENSENEGGEDEEGESVAFEIPLNTLIECLNIFGTAGPLPTANVGGKKERKWRRADDGDGDGDGDGNYGSGERTRGPIDNFFGGGKDDKRTGMRMSFAGPGYPLTLLIAEDSTGPTTTCDITTFDPEPSLELPFDSDATVLNIILKSSWLRDALSEIDPSCHKLTFIGNPPTPRNSNQPGGKAKPMLRIQAVGDFGSTEMDYPNDKEVLESFTCVHPLSVSYHTAHISRAMRALSSSSKTSLRIEEGGLLSLQFILPGAAPGSGPVGKKDKNAFIEFRCLALDSDV